jgi:hypothetical protein
MTQSQSKNTRKLVTFTPDLAERVDAYRSEVRASSDSDAIKALIEAGLKLRDKPSDLYRRCVGSTQNGQSIGDLINLVTSDHPLVASTVLDSDSLIVNLKGEDSTIPNRFRYSREEKKWFWEIEIDYNDWSEKPTDRPSSNSDDLDDEIPF